MKSIVRAHGEKYLDQNSLYTNSIVPFREVFKAAKRWHRFSWILLWISSVILFIVIVPCIPKRYKYWLDIANCIIIVLIQILEFIGDYLHYRAESHRRDDLVDNAFESHLAENRTEGYYSNDSVPAGMDRMCVNSFESSYYTYRLSKKELPNLWFMVILFLLSFVIFGAMGDKNLFILMIKFSIPILLIGRLIRYNLVVLRLECILDRFRVLFDSNSGAQMESRKLAECVRNILDYESTITWGKILLKEKWYNKMGDQLEKEWNQIKSEYSIDT